MLILRKFTFDEAKYVIDTWHYSAHLGSGHEFFGAELDGELLATAVFLKSSFGEDVIELMATAKNRDKKFYMSQLLKYCRNQLKEKYNLLITFYEITRSKGWQSQGDNWNYSGIVTGKRLEPKEGGNQYLYWIPLNETGKTLAKSLGLEAKPYPK